MFKWSWTETPRIKTTKKRRKRGNLTMNENYKNSKDNKF